jgi:hypothetical protein
MEYFSIVEEYVDISKRERARLVKAAHNKAL